MDLENSHFFRNSSKKNISFCFRIFSGVIKEKQPKLCPAIGLSTSSKSTYLGFSEPSLVNFRSNAVFLAEPETCFDFPLIIY